MSASRRLVAVLGGVIVALLLTGYMAARASSAAQGEGAAAQAAAPEAVPARDVVIIWCAGTPGAPAVPSPEVGPVDAVTQATAEAGNIKETAEKLGKELETAGHSVLLVSAEECRDPRVLVNSKALVLACPDYFGLPPWQMVRFFDETLYRLYAARVRLDGHVVTAFATTDRILSTLEGVLGSTGGKAVKGAVIASRHTSAADRDALVKQLAERIAAALK
jgi:hypothetical protein